MVYLNNTQEAQTIFIPKVFTGATGNLSLHLRNTIDLDVVIDDVIDIQTSDLYFNLSISLPVGMVDGEYEYSLSDNGEILSTGILVIGEMTAQTEQYNKSIQYEQYSTE